MIEDFCKVFAKKFRIICIYSIGFDSCLKEHPFNAIIKPEKMINMHKQFQVRKQEKYFKNISPKCCQGYLLLLEIYVSKN